MVIGIVERRLKVVEVALAAHFALCAITISGGVAAEDFLKVIFPTLVDHRAVGDDERATHTMACVKLTHAPRQFEGAQRLAKAHLRIPKELGVLKPFLEIPESHRDGLFLLGSQHYAATTRRVSPRLSLYRLNGCIYCHADVSYLFAVLFINDEKRGVSFSLSFPV